MSNETVVYPRSRIFKAEIEFPIAADATEEEILDWLKSNLLMRSSLRGDNPLDGSALESLVEPKIVDTGMHLHESLQAGIDAAGASIRRWTSQVTYDGPSIHKQLERHLETLKGSDEDPAPRR